MVLPAIPPHETPSITLYADGGTLGGSPGRGVYWSVGNYQGVTYGEDTTGQLKRSDEAEYLALLAALKILTHRCKPGDIALIYMDCRPVVRHVRTQHKPKNPRLRPLYWEVQEQLDRLRRMGIRVVLQWVSRKEIVPVLGH